MALQGCRMLRALHLDHNDLTALPEWLPPTCPRLGALDASSHRLATLPANMHQHWGASLQTLHLASNALAALPAGFGGLDALQDLDLQVRRVVPRGGPLVRAPGRHGKLTTLCCCCRGVLMCRTTSWGQRCRRACGRATSSSP